MSDSTGRRLMRVLPLLAILALGVQLRLTFYQGVIHTDDLVYSQLAWRLAEGVSPFAEPLPPTFAALRIGLYGPVALGYWLFGANDVTTLAWPFFCSLVGILGAYGIGRLLHSDAAGLLGAFFLAVLPTNVAAATALLGDGPIAAMSIATVFFVALSGRTTGRRSVAALLTALACFGIGVLNKPLILLLLPFLLVMFGRRLQRSRWTIGAVVVALAGSLTAYLLYFGGAEPAVRPGVEVTLARLADTGTDLWQQLVLGQRELAWIAPLWIVAMVSLLAWRRRDAGIVMLWLGVTFLFGELGTRTLTAYTPIVWYDTATAARHFLLLATPAMILAGLYLADSLSTTTARRLVVLASAVTALCAWVGSRGASTVTWGVTGEAPSALPFAVLSAVATIVVVFGGIASPAILRASSTTVRIGGTAVLVLSVGLASLNHAYRAAVEFRNPWVETLPETLRLLEAQPPLPILVQNDLLGMRLDYLSGFTLGFDAGLRPNVREARIHLAPADPAMVTGHYVLVDEHHLAIETPTYPVGGPAYLRNPAASWLAVAEFGQYRGSHLKVYRVSSGSAADELAAARAAVQATRTASTLRHLLQAAAAAGEYCEAVRTWHDLKVIARDQLAAFDPVPILAGCYAADPSLAGPSVLTNGDFLQGLTAWSSHPDSNATIQVQTESDGVPVWHAILRGGNWSPITQEQVLQADTPYLFEATVRSTVPVVALYWQHDIGQYYQESTYASWTTLSYVFVTPRWEHGARTVGLHPVLMRIAGEAWIKNLRLSELKRPPS